MTELERLQNEAKEGVLKAIGGPIGDYDLVDDTIDNLIALSYQAGRDAAKEDQKHNKNLIYEYERIFKWLQGLGSNSDPLFPICPDNSRYCWRKPLREMLDQARLPD